MSHRTQITLGDEHYETLLAESARSGLALAELVRRAIEHTYSRSDSNAFLAALDASFGIWSDREEDGEAYVERLRRGMAHRLSDL